MKIFLALVAVALISGCAHSSHVLTGPARPSVSPETVRVYSTMPTNATEIAILSGYANNIYPDSTIRAMQRDAAKLGANGLVIRDTVSGLWIGAHVSGIAVFVP